MSKTGRINYRRGERGMRNGERFITVRSERLDAPDLRKLSRAVIAMAMRDAESKQEVRAAIKNTDFYEKDSDLLIVRKVRGGK